MSDVGLPARSTPYRTLPSGGRGVYGSYRLRPEKLGSFRGWVTE